MAPDSSRWVRLLLRFAALRASEAELGDVLEECARGRSPVWAARQLLSTLGRRPSHVAVQKGRAEMLSNLWNDIRYAARNFRRSPGFTVAAIAPIALGTGINIGLFSILNSIAWRPLPVPNATELVSVHQVFQGVQKRSVHGARSMFSIPEYLVYRDARETLAGLTAYSRPWTVTLGGESPQEIDGVLVACNYFDVLRVKPAHGPGLTAANCGAPGAPPAVILSHALWTRAFAADPEIAGRTVTLNGEPVAVVGIAPEGFGGIDLTKVAFFAPTSFLPIVQPGASFLDDAHVSWLTLVGRRRRGVGIERVRAELALIAGRIDRQQPGRTTTLIVEPATALSLPVARRDVFNGAAVVLAAFGMVLLIACANVANLLLARAAGRSREIAVRMAVGASRRRLVQQLLTESALIALAGSAVGLLLAWWSFQSLLVLLVSSLPRTIPPLSLDAHPDFTVLGFALALAAITALAFGVVPAFQASKQDVQTALKQDGDLSSGRGGRSWLRSAMVGLQIAVCMVLVIATGLLLRGLYAAQTVDPGFDYQDVTVVSLNLGAAGSDDRVAVLQSQFMERVGGLPGVDGVAAVSKVPLSPGRHQTMFRLPEADRWHQIDVNRVSSEYFSLLSIPVVRGRTFRHDELREDSRAVIITEATARRYWPDQDPVGRTLVMGLEPGRDVSLEIVGVANDAQVSEIGETSSSYMYLPGHPSGGRRLQLLVRSQTDLPVLAAGVHALTRELDRGLVVQVNRLEENLELWRTVSRLTAGLAGSLSLLALVLASIGVYGVVSYVVSRRRREVGIRMTLGADARDVRRLILRQTLRPVAVGAFVGIAGAAALSRALQSVLFGVSPLDPIAFVGAPLFLFCVAAIATLVPTRDAVKLDPMAALRGD